MKEEISDLLFKKLARQPGLAPETFGCK